MKVLIGGAFIAALVVVGVATANMDGGEEGVQDWQVEGTQEAHAEREHTRDKELACIESGGVWGVNTETCRQLVRPSSSSSRDRDPLPTVDIGSSDILEEESKQTTCMLNGGRWQGGQCFGDD